MNRLSRCSPDAFHMLSTCSPDASHWSTSGVKMLCYHVSTFTPSHSNSKPVCTAVYHIKICQINTSVFLMWYNSFVCVLYICILYSKTACCLTFSLYLGSYWTLQRSSPYAHPNISYYICEGSQERNPLHHRTDKFLVVWILKNLFWIWDYSALYEARLI